MRECGGCTACCVRLRIPELGKEPHRVCPNQGSSGCLKYESRPQSCRDYACLWLDEGSAKLLKLGEEARPDRLGVVFSMGPTDWGTPPVPVVLALEVTAGAADLYWPNKIIKRLAKRYVVAVKGVGEVRMLVGPERMLARVTKKEAHR